MHPPLSGRVRRSLLCADILAEDQTLSGARLEIAAQNVDGRGFSGAVYAHKSSTFVFIDMKRNVGKERFVIKLLFYMVTS